MAENDKGLGSKFLGLFVEREGQSAPADDADKSPAEIVAELARKSGAPHPAAAPGAPGAAAAAPAAPPSNLKLDKMTAGSGAPADFDVIFRDAGMDAGDLDRVKKAEDLLKGLPLETPDAVKKQIVEASLKAFGFEIEKIVGAANNQKRALDTYVKVNEQVTTKAIADAETQVKALVDKIAALKADSEKREKQLKALIEAATSRKAQVQKVLEFFERPLAPKP